MKDISYDILDLFKTYGSTREGMDQALDQDERPQVLHALSPIRENLLEWLDLTGQDQVLELGSGYGVFTGLLAGRCAHVTVVEFKRMYSLDCMNRVDGEPAAEPGKGQYNLWAGRRRRPDGQGKPGRPGAIV